MHTLIIDFTLAFPQAYIDVDILMELPLGVDVPKGEIRKDYVLFLFKNICGFEQASRTYFDYLCDHLRAKPIDMVPSRVDQCIWYTDGIILVIYIDECLMYSRKKSTADELKYQLSTTFIIIYGEDVNKYTGTPLSFSKHGP